MASRNRSLPVVLSALVAATAAVGLWQGRPEVGTAGGDVAAAGAAGASLTGDRLREDSLAQPPPAAERSRVETPHATANEEAAAEASVGLRGRLVAFAGLPLAAVIALEYAAQPGHRAPASEKPLTTKTEPR